MKVVHLISSFGAGGAELLVKEIARNTEKSINVEIWAIGETNDKEFESKYINEMAANSIECIKIGKIAGKNRLQVIKKLRAALKERKPDIINTHSELVTFYVLTASIGLKTIIVETIHNTVIGYRFLQKYFARPLLKKYIAISGKCEELIKNEITSDPGMVELIFNGIEIEKFQKQERIINPDVMNIMCVGRLDVQKDHNTLLKAFARTIKRLKSENLNIPQLNIIGAGVLKDTLINLTRELEIEAYVNFMGVRNDVPQLLYQNDIWVMSSKWEGLSIALLEAFASGIPVVATDVGSNSEVIEDGISGVLVPKESPELLSERLYSLLNNYEMRKKFSDNARRKAAGFHIKNCTEGYVKLHKSLVTSTGKKINLKNAGKAEISKVL